MTQPTTFSSTTPRFSLPFLFQGQAQREFFVNEAFSLLDSLVMISVEGQGITPPSDPSEGESWLIAPNATGQWEGRDDSIAIFIAGSWKFVEPDAGAKLFDRLANQTAFYRNGWHYAPIPTLPSGGGVIDQEARNAIDQILTVLQNIGATPDS